MFYTPDDFERAELFPGVWRHTVSHGEQIHIVYVTGEAGAEVPLHQHVHEQAGVVLTGQIELTVGDEPPRLLNPGDGYAIPSNTPHSVRWPVAATVYDIFSPTRKEYI